LCTDTYVNTYTHVRRKLITGCRSCLTFSSTSFFDHQNILRVRSTYIHRRKGLIRGLLYITDMVRPSFGLLDGRYVPIVYVRIRPAIVKYICMYISVPWYICTYIARCVQTSPPLPSEKNYKNKNCGEVASLYMYTYI